VSGVDINITNFVFNAGGGFSNIVIRTDKIIESFTGNRTWINVGGIVGSRRVYNIPFYIDENFFPLELNGSIDLVIGGINYGVSINQASRVGTLNSTTQLTISPGNIDVNNTAQNFTVEVRSNGFWKVVNEGILTVNTDLGFGDDDLIFSIPENTTGAPRVISPQINSINNNIFNTLTVTQKA
jgi:hypothetical protein